jgi:hypothetical protein
MRSCILHQEAVLGSALVRAASRLLFVSWKYPCSVALALLSIWGLGFGVWVCTYSFSRLYHKISHSCKKHHTCTTSSLLLPRESCRKWWDNYGRVKSLARESVSAGERKSLYTSSAFIKQVGCANKASKVCGFDPFCSSIGLVCLHSSCLGKGTMQVIFICALPFVRPRSLAQVISYPVRLVQAKI